MITRVLRWMVCGGLLLLAPALALPALGADEAPAAEKPAAAADEHGDHGHGEHGHDDHGHGGHAHHSLVEKYDIGHGNATANLERPEQFNRFDLSIYTFVVFALLMALLYKFAWGPISRGLDAREQSISKMIADAQAASETASKQLQEYERRLAAAQEEAGRIVAEARRQADEVAAAIRAEAEAAAQKERDRAVAEIDGAKNQALREIAQQSIATAVDLAGKIIRREVREADHQQLIAESLSRFNNN